mmetsp:Transcript_2184/g.14500  ORF Transcript_2184/g.14500 Transcript_2184/m.14500 type:complete len:343 (+) Transcript_2184:2675-3703(+)
MDEDVQSTEVFFDPFCHFRDRPSIVFGEPFVVFDVFRHVFHGVVSCIQWIHCRQLEQRSVWQLPGLVELAASQGRLEDVQRRHPRAHRHFRTCLCHGFGDGPSEALVVGHTGHEDALATKVDGQAAAGVHGHVSRALRLGGSQSTSADRKVRHPLRGNGHGASMQLLVVRLDMRGWEMRLGRLVLSSTQDGLAIVVVVGGCHATTHHIPNTQTHEPNAWIMLCPVPSPCRLHPIQEVDVQTASHRRRNTLSCTMRKVEMEEPIDGGRWMVDAVDALERFLWVKGMACPPASFEEWLHSATALIADAGAAWKPPPSCLCVESNGPTYACWTTPTRPSCWQHTL